jgi:hypothetical protein
MTVKQNSEQMMLGMLAGEVKQLFRRRTGDNIPVTKSKYIYFNDLDGS